MLAKKLLVVAAETLALTSGFLVTDAPVHAASTYKVLHVFTGKDGANPSAGLVFDSVGNLYGTTVGSRTCGTVFKLAPGTNGSWTRTVLHYFGGENGCQPYAGLTFDAAGNLYGSTAGGGAYNGGTVFQLSPSANGKWTQKVLHSFSGKGSDGYVPYAGLIFDPAGNLYGTTYGGGAHQGGTVFELSPGANGKWTQAVLHGFCSLPKCADGEEPHTGVIFDSSGSLYGTTFGGGPAGKGTVFKLAPSSSGWKETVLYSFCSLQNCNDGSEPYGVVFDMAGSLYGTTSGGGTSGYGTVFEVLAGSPSGQSTETVLHNFDKSDGALPYGTLTFDAAGNLYGTTNEGGNVDCNCGTVFELAFSNGQWTETVLHVFFRRAGAGPLAGPIFDSAGNLYGTTFYGGALGDGTVFELTP
jgi:uncharacterized repeat protein (TIGR03803 family)